MPISSSSSPPQTRADLPAASQLLARFNSAFGLMTVIPLLTCVYVLTVRFYSINILEGLNGVYFLLALAIALLGLLAGHQLIRDIVKRLLDANARLAQLNDRQATFVGNVAHEFRAPLGVFKAALDNLADGLHGPLTSDQAEPVAMCRREAKRLTRLVSDLLDLTRIEAGRLPMAREAVVAQDVLASAAQMFTGLLKERHLSFAMDLPQEPVRLIGDRDRLEQVFVNLLANAAKFTEQGGIEARLISDGQSAQVEIADTGPGIAEEDRERIFDKFERLGTGQEEGSGLGLPIARHIVELHHGRVWVESEIGRGSRFIVRLPLNQPSTAVTQ